MALVGNLKDLKLPSLIQLNCMEKNTAKLTIEHHGRFGSIYFENGQVVHAEYDPHIGEEAVYQLLSLYSGNFKVESGIRAPAHTIHTSWNNLLLEGMKQIDDSDPDQNSQFNALFSRIMTINGIKSVQVVNREGELYTASTDQTSLSNPIHAFAIHEMENIAAVLELDRPEFFSLTASPQKFVYTAYSQFYLILELDAKTKLDIIIPQIRQAFK
jgi:hypothetical protein